MIETGASERLREKAVAKDARKISADVKLPSDSLGKGQLACTSGTLSEAHRISPVVWLNLLCLDAPFVALGWQWIFARSLGVQLSVAARAALFLTAWLIYLSDRYADARRIRDGEIRSLRQEFCRRHLKQFARVIFLVAVVDGWIILRHLDMKIVGAGATVGIASVMYLAVNYSLGQLWRRLPAKEIFIGFLFACGTSTAIFASGKINHPALVALTVSFGALCVLNCISIAIWERALDLAQKKESIATQFPRMERVLAPIIFALIAANILAAKFYPPMRSAFLSLGLSALLLLLVHLGRHKIESNSRTALADLVLFTPGVFFLAQKFFCLA